MFNSVHPCTLLNDEICAMHKSRCCLCTQPSLASFCSAKRTSSLLTQTSTVLTRRSAGEKPYRVFRMKNSKVINVQGCTLMTRRPCRHGGRGDKTITSFHKNVIFVKTRKVMGNTDVAHYRGHLGTIRICSEPSSSENLH